MRRLALMACAVLLGIAALEAWQRTTIFRGPVDARDTVSVDGLLTAEGNLQVDGVHTNPLERGEISSSAGSMCVSFGSGEAATNEWSFAPVLTGSGATMDWVPSSTDAPRYSLSAALGVTSRGTITHTGIPITPAGLADVSGTLYAVSSSFNGGYQVVSFSPTDPTSATVEGTLPSAFGPPAGLADVGGTLYGISTSRNVFSFNPSNPAGATSTGTLPSAAGTPRGLANVAGTLYTIAGSTGRPVWSFPLSAPGSATSVAALPAAVGNPRGLTYVSSASTLYVVGNNPSGREFYSFDPADPAGATRIGALPTSVGNPTGLTNDDGGTLYVVGAARQVSEIAGQGCVEWRYIPASDNPMLFAAVDGAGRVRALWQSEDPSESPELSDVRDWTGATYTPMEIPLPEDAILTGLYGAAEAPVQAAALDRLRTYLQGRGWLASPPGVGGVAALVGSVPDSGCGAPDGDCEPAARLHALRALAAAGDETVFDLVAREARISAAGEWSLAP